jgi:4-hydroxy-3-polyprenylbenzoate decarboxylase
VRQTDESEEMAPVRKRFVVAISGASGTRYGVRVLEVLSARPDLEVHLVMTEMAKEVLALETDLELEDVQALADFAWEDADLKAPLASGTFTVEAMAVVPCSVSTVAKIASGIGDTLLTRSCSVSLKERRRLVIVPREMPMSTIDLRNLATLSEAGAVIAVASPPLYTRPSSVDDVVDLIAGRVLELLGLDPGSLLKRYGHK